MRWLLCCLLVTCAWGQAGVQGGAMLTGIPILTKSACGAPNYCSLSNPAIDQTSAPAGLLGLTGFNSSVIDITGNKIIRATDYTMSGGLPGNSFFKVNSDSNDNVWSSDDQMFGVVRGGSALVILAFNPSTQQVTPKGIGLATGDAVGWSYATPATYYGSASAGIMQKFTINTSSPTWTGSSSATTALGPATTTTNLVTVSTDCTSVPFNRYASLTTVYLVDSADRWISFGERLAQDQGSQIFLYDSTRGCHWVDLRTMTQGGAWGTGALSFANTVLLPAPPAPTLTQVNNGSGALVNAHQYTVCIAYEKTTIGETPCSATSSTTMGGGNNAFTVTPPSATPANTVTVPTGFNVYACDNTAVPGCTPTLQTNGTNASGVLAQPTGGSLACLTNCSGSTNYTMWVVANNAGGSSPYSAAITSASNAVNATFNLSINQVTNASTYTVYCDFQYVKCGNSSAGSCGAGVCTLSVNTNPTSVPFSLAWDETTPIATTPTILSTTTGTQAAQSINGSGAIWHDLKNDGTGWLTATFAGAAQAGPSYNINPAIYIDTATSTVLFASNTSTPAINAAKAAVGHRVVAFGKFLGFDSNVVHPVVYVLNDSSATVEASKYFLSNTVTSPSDVHFGAHVRSLIPTAPWYVGSDGSNYMSHSIPVLYLGAYIWGIQDVANTALIYKFCQNWESGLQGFNSQVSGHQSPDGKFIAFSSDMGIGAGVTSGQLGSTSGAGTCTDNVDCREDIFICVTR